MKIVVIGKNEKGEILPLKHPEEIDIDLVDVGTFSTDKFLRLVGVDKNLFRLSLKSYKELKKELSKRGILARLDLSRKV